jgi:hypothetical protein
MRAVRVSVHGRDVRGLKKWSHAVRSGPDVTIGCSGVLVGENLVFAPIGSLLDGWSDAVVSIDGVRASSWALLENTSSVFWDFKFCLITCSCSVDKTALPRSLLTVEQYAMHLTQPHWGLLVQPCRVVCQPASFVSLIDVSCYEGGEGGLVAGIEERFIVARGLMADGAPTGLSVCVAISHLLNLPTRKTSSAGSCRVSCCCCARLGRYVGYRICCWNRRFGCNCSARSLQERRNSS